MAKIKLTKNELKKQKDALKRFNHYLPTLQLKKQQLQSEILKINTALDELRSKIDLVTSDLNNWVEVFSEDVKLEDLLSVDKIITDEGNIAGIDIPVFKEIVFKEKDYDYWVYPLWVDFALDYLREIYELKAKELVFNRQLLAVKEELRITTQRVNLFEKVKIPEARENIRKIRICLGDMQTASVVRGKIAKVKIQKKEEAMV